MKYSLYNSILPLTKQSSMAYNAVSDKFIIFNNSLKQLFKESPTKAKDCDARFYEQLENGGFLVNDDIDEEKEIVSLGRKFCSIESDYRLIINPTTNCNFRCWYCYENHSSKSKMNEETVLRIEKMLWNIGHDEKIKTLSLSFFGGEPLLYYEDTVRPLIDTVRKVGKSCNLRYSIHFTTNGFLVNNRMVEHLAEVADEKTFQITLDGHREQHNKVRFSTSGRGSYDRILKNIKLLLSHKMAVGLRINYTKENASSIIDILTDLKDIPSEDRKLFNVDFQKVWQENGLSSNDKTINDAISSFREEFASVSDYYSHVNAFRHPCYADMVNECVVNFNGDVYKCTARDFTLENSLGHLSEKGEVVWDDPKLMEHRLAYKFDRAVCRKCRIFPLCGGGCAQTSKEADKYAYTKCSGELEKDEIILSRFYNNVIRPSETKK